MFLRYLYIVLIFAMSITVISYAQEGSESFNADDITLIGNLGIGNRHIALSPNG